MKLRLSTKKILWLGIASLCMLFLYAYIRIYNNGASSRWNEQSSVIILVMLLLEICLLRVFVPKKRLLIYVVVFLEFVFHFSHIILSSFNYDFGSNTNNNVFFRFSADTVKESVKYSLIGSAGIITGILIFYIFANKSKHLNDELVVFREYNRNVEKLFLAIGLATDMLISARSLIAAKAGGYIQVATSTGTFSGLTCLSYLLLAGILLVLQDDMISLRKRKIILVAFCVYKCVTMFSGLRAFALINIFIAIYVFLKSNKLFKINLKYIILGVLLFQFAGGFIVGIRETRLSGISLPIIISYMFDIKSNILFNMMGEFGITQNTVCLVLENMNNSDPIGMQLLYSIIIIVPGISYIAPNLNYSMAFMEARYDMHNYGGSFMADMLFDFGKIGMFMSCLVLGIILSYIFEWFEMSIDRRNVLRVSVFSPIVVQLIYSVRSSLAKIPRITVWYLLMVSVILLLLNKKKIKI